jgi:hypothetical protein
LEHVAAAFFHTLRLFLALKTRHPLKTQTKQNGLKAVLTKSVSNILEKLRRLQIRFIRRWCLHPDKAVMRIPYPVALPIP